MIEFVVRVVKFIDDGTNQEVGEGGEHGSGSERSSLSAFIDFWGGERTMAIFLFSSCPKEPRMWEFDAATKIADPRQIQGVSCTTGDMDLLHAGSSVQGSRQRQAV